MGLPGSANKNTGRPVKADLQINNKYLSTVSMFPAVFGTYAKKKKKKSFVYLKFRVNGAICMLLYGATLALRPAPGVGAPALS